MVKAFFVLVTLLVVLLGGIFLHYTLHDDMTMKSNENIVKLTKIASPSLSVAYYEPRILFFEAAVNPAYPQMQTIDKTDLVYAK